MFALNQVGQRGRVLDEPGIIFKIKEVDVDGGIMLVVPDDDTSASELWIFEGTGEYVESVRSQDFVITCILKQLPDLSTPL